MATDGPRLARFEPELTPPPTNGTHVKRRGRVLGGVAFGFLLGALVATSLVPRIQWLNLSKVGWWGRPAIAGVLAGALVGMLRRDRLRATMLAGAIAASLALWSVYLLMRAGVEIIFVERSFAEAVAIDLTLLGACAIPSGALGAFVARQARARAGRAPRAGR